ncbi:MAG TPA: CotH kinase family protein [Vicinamibacterales bacterium]|jgi:spore coat protein CotH|nr:CotH kinase family protein [Vicinamibacterales bacterium]
MTIDSTFRATGLGALVVSAFLMSTGSAAQLPGGPGPGGPPDGRGGFGGFGGVQAEQKLVAQFDKDGNKRLDAAERAAALDYVESQGGGRRGGFGRRGGGPFGGSAATPSPGPRVARDSVKTYPASVPFYDLGTLRTLFFDFEDANWEKELMAFKETDVEVPATMTVDGRTYADVGVSFRGSSSFMMVPEGLKHSINVSVDFASKTQNVDGYRSLNLLNSHEDPSFLRSVLFLKAARDYLPAAQANLVRVVINGELWGIFANVEQINKDFIERHYGTSAGARWKVPGSPRGRGGLEYSGDDVAAYKRVFEIKSKDDPKSWAALVRLAKTLNGTPVDRLEAALAPMLDIDEVLKFLALDATFVNNDGYWTRASDYDLYLDPKGVFRLFPHDTNETFAPESGPGGRGFGGRGGPAGPDGRGGLGPGGFGGRGGPDGRGGLGGRGGFMMGGDATLDLLVGLDDSTKPLRSKLLAVPSLRAKYLAYCKQMAEQWLDWKTLGPIVTSAHALVAADVEAETRKLDSFEAFEASVGELQRFAETRRAFVAAYPAR